MSKHYFWPLNKFDVKESQWSQRRNTPPTPNTSIGTRIPTTRVMRQWYSGEVSTWSSSFNHRVEDAFMKSGLHMSHWPFEYQTCSDSDPRCTLKIKLFFCRFFTWTRRGTSRRLFQPPKAVPFHWRPVTSWKKNYNVIWNPLRLELRTFWRSDIKWSGLSYGYNPNRSKTGLFKIKTFLSGFQFLPPV